MVDLQLMFANQRGTKKMTMLLHLELGVFLTQEYNYNPVRTRNSSNARGPQLRDVASLEGEYVAVLVFQSIVCDTKGAIVRIIQ